MGVTRMWGSTSTGCREQWRLFLAHFRLAPCFSDYSLKLIVFGSKKSLLYFLPPGEASGKGAQLAAGQFPA